MSNQRQKIWPLVSKILVYLIALYIVFILGKAIWTNWQLNRQIHDMQQQIADINTQNKNLENLILYYKSDSFREVEARKKLGLKKPGEIAIAVPTQNNENYNQETEAQKQGVSETPKEENIPNWQLWWQFFTK